MVSPAFLDWIFNTFQPLVIASLSLPADVQFAIHKAAFEKFFAEHPDDPTPHN